MQRLHEVYQILFAAGGVHVVFGEDGIAQAGDGGGSCEEAPDAGAYGVEAVVGAGIRMAASPPRSHETWAGEAWTREFRSIGLLVSGNGTRFVLYWREAQEKPFSN